MASRKTQHNLDESELLTIREEDLLEGYGCFPHRRPLESYLKKGFVNINKPKGPTSHQVSEWVKNILHLNKTGHTGTLDPAVTGVFPVALEDSTKGVKILLKYGKEYIALMHLHEEVPETRLREVMDEFVGKVYQKPPLKSAVKRELRVREIYSIEILEIVGKDVLFKVSCEAGTYIRRICTDIGMVLGCGAHMQQLIRTRVANFDESNIVSLQDLKDAYETWAEEKDETLLREIVAPLEKVLSTLLPKIVISDYAINALCHGAQLAIPGILKLDSCIKKGDTVCVFTQKGEAVLIGEALRDAMKLKKLKKGLAVKTERVFMNEDEYPRIKKDGK